MLHGLTGHKTEAHRLFVKTARALQRAGFVGLRFDFRGWGDSAGDSEDSSISSMIEDASAATDFLLAQPGVDATRLGYLGFSTGGAVAAQAIAKDARPKALVLWNPVADGHQIFRGLINAERARSMTTLGKVDHNGNYLSRKLVEEFMSMKPVAALGSRPLPTLIVSADNDGAVPPVQSDSYLHALQKLGVRCEKATIAKADHVFTSVAWEQEVIERTVKWFATSL
jgi:hypothetical protein